MIVYRVVMLAVLLVLVTGDDDDGTYILDSPADKIAGNPGFCYVEELGLFNNKEPIKQGTECSQVRCMDNGQYEQKVCPPIEGSDDPTCIVVFTPDVPFPKCCEGARVECPE